jgi:phosphoribosylaminoimidazolecarboxamide formyltransferase/IMP cyclohydrolase
METVKIKRALVSVTDKSGIAEFCRALADEFGVEIVSTGGTAAALAEAGVPVRAIDELTGFPEMMDGRVKTLHPKVHGGLLARRDSAEHMAQAEAHGIGMIDMVVVNLYPFQKTVAREGVTPEEARTNIDIGGPCMVRASAKNYLRVASVTDPADYGALLAELSANGGTLGFATRLALMKKAFAHTAQYDTAIAAFFAGVTEDRGRSTYEVHTQS